MSKEYILALKVTGDGKLAVKAIREVGDEAQRAGKQLQQVGAKAKQSTDDMQGGLRGVIGQLKTVVAVTGALTIAKYLADTSDNAVLTAARIGLVTRSLGEQKRVSGELLDIANKMQLPFQELANSYPRLARAIKDYGGSTADAVNVTRIFAQTVKLSGASQAEAAASALQFAQALSSGRLAGDELRSVLENNSVLAASLAEGLGVTVGELRKMGEEGALTSQKVVQALLTQQAKLDALAEKIPKTIAGGLVQIANEMSKVVESSDLLTTANQGMANGLVEVATRMDATRKSGVNLLDTFVMLASAAARFDPGAVIRVLQNTGAAEPSGTGNFRRGEVDYQNAQAEEAKKAAEAALRGFRDLTKEAETAEGANARYNVGVEKVMHTWRALAAAGALTAEKEKQLTTMIVAEGMKRADAIEGYNKKGTSSLTAQIAIIEKRTEMERDAAENRYRLEVDTLKREQEILEFQRAAGLVTEQQYLDKRASQQQRAADLSLAKIAEFQQAETLARARKAALTPRDAGERASLDANVLEQEKKLADLTNQRTIAERALGDAIRKRGQDQYLLDSKLLERLTAIDRETDDYIRSLREQTAEMQFEFDLIGQSDIAQKQLTATRKIRLAVEKEIHKITREIADLEAKGGDPDEIAARKKQIDQIRQNAEVQIDESKRILRATFDAQEFKRIGDSLADALIDGGKEAGPRIRNILQEELKKPIKLAISALIQQGMAGISQSFGINPSSAGGLFGNLFGGSSGTPYGPTPDGGNIAGAAGAFGGMGAAAGMGGLFGGLAANAFGAGDRGVQNATNYAAIGAAIGSVIPVIGTVIGAAIGAIIGIFSDPEGDANRTAQVGTNPAGNYSYSGTSAFGTFGTFADRWFSDSDMGDTLRSFFTQQSNLENLLAREMSPEQRATAAARLAQPQEYSFGVERGSVQGLAEITRDRLAIIVETVLPGLGQLVEGFRGTGEELVKLVDSLFALRKAGEGIDAMIAQIGGNATDILRLQMDAIDTRITQSRSAFAAALAAKDPVQILQSEQQLTQAIMQRYQSEISMVRQLQDSIEQLREQAYQFSLNIASRINATGGARNISAIAMNRADVLRGGIGGNQPLGTQARNLQGYVGAIDTWYQARRDAIARQDQAAQQANQAIAQAQQSAAQARIAALEQELGLAEQYKSIVERTQSILDDMRLTAQNPLSTLGRLGLTTNDVEGLRGTYANAQGSAKVEAANRLIEAIQRRLSLGAESYQRPTADYQTIYNESISELTALQQFAQTEAQRAIELQERIASLQELSNSYQAATAQYSATSSAALTELDTEARTYYEWAEAEGARVFAEQERQHLEQLNAITGGMEVELFIAQRQAQAVDELREIKELLRLFLAGGGVIGAPVPVGKPNGTLVTDSGGRGGDIIFGDVIIRGAEKMSAQDFLIAVSKAAPQLKRMLTNA